MNDGEIIDPTGTPVMIVDDDPALRHAVTSILDRWGFPVCSAGSGGEALARVREFRPHVAIVDVSMPLMDGHEVCRRLKEIEELQPLKVILISGKAVDMEARIGGLTGGADEFLAKPFATEDLLTCVIAMARLRSAEKKVLEASERLEKRVAERTRELAESEERYRTIFEHAMHGLMVVDQESGEILSFNRHVHENLGYTREEFLRLGIVDIEAQESAEDIRRHIDRIRKDGGDRFVTRHRTKDGEIRDVRIHAVNIMLGGRPCHIAALQDISEQIRTEARLRQLAGLAITAQENERRRVSRELHDGVSQLLASIRFRIRSICEKQSAETAGLGGELEQVGALLDDVQNEVRRISHNLRPVELDDLGFCPAAERACEEFAQRTGIQVEASVSPFPRGLSKETELTLYRVLQEGLSNIEKHADASRVSLETGVSGDTIRFKLKDNGRGFDEVSARKPHRGSGIGLDNIRERVANAGGRLEVKARLNEGVEIDVQLPCRSESRD